MKDYLIEEIDHFLEDDEHRDKTMPYVAFYEEGDIVYYDWEEPIYSVETEVIRGVYNVKKNQDIHGYTEENGYTVIEVQTGE